ncbi:MAG: hypothetical protein IPF81_11745 [Bacteroidetes bacterium]|nr:hypothetical protein [Bacteroidota bacterium]
MSYQVGNIKSIPFVEVNIEEIEALAKECIRISKDDWDSREISWNFNSSPLLNGCKTLEESFIKWANKRLLELFNLHNHEERINELFILAYQVQTDFVKDIALQDISILDDELIKTNLDSKIQILQNINQFKKCCCTTKLISYFCWVFFWAIQIE